MSDNGKPVGEVDYNVNIIDAGPTGLTLANLLGQLGAPTLVVERTLPR